MFQWAWKQSGSQVIIIVDAPGLEEDIRHPHKSPPSGVCVSVVRDTTAHLSGQDRKTHIVHRYTRGPSHGGHPQSTLPCRSLHDFSRLTHYPDRSRIVRTRRTNENTKTKSTRKNQLSERPSMSTAPQKEVHKKASGRFAGNGAPSSKRPS